ncbi:hypothetical protein JAAARDRAFT_193092 [Jaapia argillacea MUCL 33604]|uniref:FAD-binding domain-containing protein n=1 Tax=Jaapia argillacea MUCL 33604 TaxID=933084 RepID=A0A067PUN2_9AGAM|nr:hypothetical protein JAAARDRAFT_193092 [Jaapia argillacea MUCL 33604]
MTIAIIGGRIGGITTAIALGRLGYTIHLFEQAKQFSEIGAGVALGPKSIALDDHAIVFADGTFNSSVESLRKMGLFEAYEKVADITEPDALCLQFTKDDGQVFGKWFFKATHKGRGSSVHRARLLEALLKLLPDNVTAHFSSHVNVVENIYPTDGSNLHVRLTIQPPHAEMHPEWPGEQRIFDASIAVGKHVRYTGTYAYRGLLDITKAVEKNGEGVRVPTMWFGKDKHVLTFLIEGGKIVNLVAFVSDRSQGPDERTWTGPWVKLVSYQQMFEDFKGWDQNVINLSQLIEKPEQWALHELVPLRRWTVDRITLLGDSAHASLPHNGAGAGQATEDAYVLASLLALPSCTEDTIPHFLQVYEDVRRPRASGQQIHACESGDVYEFATPMKDNNHALAENLKVRYDWIWEHDLEEDIDDAKRKLKDMGIEV